MTKIVTGFVPIPGHPRGVEAYTQSALRFMDVGTRPTIYYNTLDECWLHKKLKNSAVQVNVFPADNPRKNTLEYHIVNHQKFEWLARACVEHPACDNFIWVDYGIFHISDIQPIHISDLYHRAKRYCPYTAIPGCWDRAIPPDGVDLRWPCWRFCGGVMVVRRDDVFKLRRAVEFELDQMIYPSATISWEVNTLARLETRDYAPHIKWYQADHNKTMFTGYPCPK